MKRVPSHKSLLLGLNLICAAIFAQAQGSFQNLDFESATIIPVSGYPYDVVEFAPAFPGWIGYVGTEQQTLALHNQLFLGTAVLSIMEAPGGGPLYVPPIEGNYMPVLQPGAGGTGTVSAAIAQTGSIPVNANSLQFKASLDIQDQFLEVTVGGETISMMPVLSTGTYKLLAGNISAFAGQTRELRITALPGTFGFAVDSIEFSPEMVPEPSTLGLFALGGLLTVLHRRRC